MKEMNTKMEGRISYLILVVPALLIYLFVMAFPTVYSVALSLTNYSGGKVFGNPNFGFVGLKSYQAILTDSYFYISLKNNIYIVLISVFGQIPLGFILAYILSRGLIKGTDFFQTVIYMPRVFSAVIVGVLFNKFFLSANSVWLEIQRIFNPAVEWDPGAHPMLPVLAVILWMYTGTYVIIFLANIQKIDTSVIEAAMIDGATEMQTLRYIILPALSGVIVVSAILAISGSLQAFDLLYVMTQGGPAHRTSVLALYTYEKAFRGIPNYPVANAISTVMALISFVLIVITKAAEKFFSKE